MASVIRHLSMENANPNPQSASDSQSRPHRIPIRHQMPMPIHPPITDSNPIPASQSQPPPPHSPTNRIISPLEHQKFATLTPIDAQRIPSNLPTEGSARHSLLPRDFSSDMSYSGAPIALSTTADGEGITWALVFVEPLHDRVRPPLPSLPVGRSNALLYHLSTTQQQSAVHPTPPSPAYLPTYANPIPHIPQCRPMHHHHTHIC